MSLPHPIPGVNQEEKIVRIIGLGKEKLTRRGGSFRLVKWTGAEGHGM